MKNIKSYKLFESANEPLNQDQIALLNRCLGTWSYNESTGFVDVDGDFDYFRSKGKDFYGIKFGVVTGSFYCHTDRMVSLEGAPQKVEGDFYCHKNKLKSLKGAPPEIGGGFYCSDNILESLEGAPNEINGDFFCSNNKLESLEGSPQKVDGSFICSNNNLKSLKGAPQKIGEDFRCTNKKGIKLISLEGAPQEIGGGFYCGVFKSVNGKWSLKWAISNIDKYPILSSIVPVEALQDVINKNPGKMVMKLKKVWNKLKKDPAYASLEFPESYREVFGTLSDLADLGIN